MSNRAQPDPVELTSDLPTPYFSSVIFRPNGNSGFRSSVTQRANIQEVVIPDYFCCPNPFLALGLVRQAYQDVNEASNGLQSWHQYRTHAHYLARFGTYDGDAKEIDMASLGLYETTSLPV